MASRHFDIYPTRPLIFLVMAAVVILTTTSCSLVLDLSSCDGDQDCEEGFICSADQICLDSSAQCGTDSDCTALFGDGASCNDGLCQGDNPLTDGPCQQLYGAVDDDDALLIGVVMQLTGVGGGFGQPMLDAMRIAKRDINAIGGINGRQIGLVACDTAYDDIDPEDYGETDDSLDTVARIAATHLVETAGVEVILGLNSSQVLDIGPEITVPNDVLLVSPSATAATIPPLGHNGLIWRTAPSDEPQAVALSRFIEETVDDFLPNERGIASPKVTLLVREEDRWAEGLNDHIVLELPAEITTGGEARFTSHSFPNVGAGDLAEYEPIAATVAAEPTPPDVVVVLGSADSWLLIPQIDNAVSTEPLFIGADAMKNTEEAAQAPADLEYRIWGTGPRSVAEFDYQPYTIFRLKFEQELNANADTFQFVANAFDALYTLAFASAAALSGEDDGGVCGDADPCADGQNCVEGECVADRSISGPNLARGLTRLDQGDEIRPTSSDASQAINTLLAGGTVNYAGASGPINFDSFGDPEPMPIALWCFEDGQVPERGELYTPDGQFTPLTCVNDQ